MAIARCSSSRLRTGIVMGFGANVKRGILVKGGWCSGGVGLGAVA